MKPRYPFCFALVLGLTLLSHSAGSSDPTEPAGAEQKKALELVRQLGSDLYEEREKASEQLQRLGLAARPALEKGSTDEDAEIRRRCQDLLPAVMEIDLRNRIAAFLADKEGKCTHNLPLWPAFRKAVGDDVVARQLFAEMVQGETLSFLLDCADSPDRQGELLERFARRAQQKMYQQVPGKIPGQFGALQERQLSHGDFAALLFIGGEAKSGGGREQAPYIISSMLYQPFARPALSEGPQAPALRKLLIRWMNNQTNENVILQLTQSAQNLGLKESNDYLLSVIRDKKVRGIYMAQVVINLGRMNNKEHIPVLETLLEDQTQLGQIQFNKVRGNTELRDVALSMLVQLTGQSHKDYGFSFLAEHANLVWAPNYAGFTTSEQREAAHKKWKTWAAAQKK
jgi:hypothetical protein